MARGCDWCTIIGYLVGSCFCFGIVILLPLLLSMYGNPSHPSFSINLLDNQALNMTRPDDSPTNMTIHFDLKLKNKSSYIGLHYPDPITVTFSYFPNVSTMVILAEYKLDKFYQGNGKTRHVKNVVETNGFPTVLEGTDIVTLRVDLVGSFRYKKAGTKKRKVELGCLVDVNYTTSQKMVKPGLDSKLEPPPDDYYFFRTTEDAVHFLCT